MGNACTKPDLTLLQDGYPTRCEQGGIRTFLPVHPSQLKYPTIPNHYERPLAPYYPPHNLNYPQHKGKQLRPVLGPPPPRPCSVSYILDNQECDPEYWYNSSVCTCCGTSLNIRSVTGADSKVFTKPTWNAKDVNKNDLIIPCHVKCPNFVVSSNSRVRAILDAGHDVAATETPPVRELKRNVPKPSHQRRETNVSKQSPSRSSRKVYPSAQKWNDQIAHSKQDLYSSFKSPRHEIVLTIQDPASQRLTWHKPPLSVLVIKKARDSQVVQPFLQLVKWLNFEKRMVVFVEASVLEEPRVTNHTSFPELKDKLMSFREGQDDLTDKIDFIICLGGDGTLLYASSLFQQSIPPVMAFHLGSLGFLTPFKFDCFQDQVTNVLEGHAALTLRSRLRCIILKKEDELTNKTKNSPPPTNLLVLNEVVIDRGPSPYLSNIDLYLDGRRITSVQGDGLIVSTPTGSTAYAVAAGASMIHPSVPAIMVTPICPHSLSFRPIVVPAGVELMVKLNPEARHTCWVSFDGRHHQELFHGHSLRVTTSIYPVPSICSEDQIADWFASLDECLRWNDRKRQKHLEDDNDEEEDNNISPLRHPKANSHYINDESSQSTPELTQSSSSDTLDSLSERNEEA